MVTVSKAPIFEVSSNKFIEKAKVMYSFQMTKIDQAYQKKFLGKQVYNNTENKFELNEYEIEIEKQIITKMIDEIIIFLLELR